MTIFESIENKTNSFSTIMTCCLDDLVSTLSLSKVLVEKVIHLNEFEI